MGRDIAASLKMVEQRDPGCITVSSPGAVEHVACTDSDQTKSVLTWLNAPTQSNLCQKRSVARVTSHTTLS